eukprot:6834305-Alexandrium_andersonii.AAC.1
MQVIATGAVCSELAKVMSNDQVASFVGVVKDAFAYLSSVAIRHCAQGFAALRERAERAMVAAAKIVP